MANTSDLFTKTSATPAATPSMWSRMTGRGGAPGKALPADLKRITHSGVLDIPKELLEPVVEAAANAEDRPEIMKHIRECLAEPNGKQWRRVYGALVLVEALVKNGSPQLFDETAEGRHFDLVQRLSFLEVYDNADKRVMNNIRKKAEAVRKDVIPLIQNADGSSLEKKDDSNDIVSIASTCSPGAGTSIPSVSTMAQSSTASVSATGFGSDDVLPEIDSSEAPKGRMILNNMVSVGHNEDTTSESEGGQDKAKAAVRYREPQRKTAKERNQRSQAANGSSSDSEGASQDPKPQTKPADLMGLSPQMKPAAQSPAHTVDLLGL